MTAQLPGAGGEERAPRAPVRVRRSCQECVHRLDQAGSAAACRLDREQALRLADRLAPALLEKPAPQGVRFPLQFPDPTAEVSLLALLGLMNFGSGWRGELHRASGAGAYQTIQRGVIGLFLKDPEVKAETLAAVSASEVESWFDISARVEVPHPDLGPAVRQVVDSPLAPLVRRLQRVMNESGRILLEKQQRSLGHFILTALAAQQAPGPGTAGPSAAALVDSLVSAFPALQDEGSCLGARVYLYKKAQLIAADLFRRFGETDERFAFHDFHTLTAFADNVLPAVLRKEGVLRLSPALEQAIDQGASLPNAEDEVALRASAIAAIESMAAHIGVSEPDLDFYLWGVLGKAEGYRSFPRHSAKNTVFY